MRFGVRLSVVMLAFIGSFYFTTEPLAAPRCSSIQPNNGPVADIGIIEHGTSSNPVRAKTIAIGGLVTLDATSKNAANQPTAEIGDPNWNFPTSIVQVARWVGTEGCYVPVLRGIANGSGQITITVDGVTGSRPFAITVGSGGPIPSSSSGPSVSVLPADPAESDTMCAYREGTSINICVPNTEGLTMTGCVADPTCIAKGGCTVIERSTCVIPQATFINRAITFPPASNLGQLMEGIFNTSLMLVGIAVFVMAVYGGFLMIMAGGFPQMHAQGKGIIQNAFMGAMLLLAAYVILNTINPNFVEQRSNLPAIPPQSAPR